MLLAVSETFSEIIAYLANLSFSEGRFPAKFKSASVTPLLKSDHLDQTAPASYRPISNLNFISKILERHPVFSGHPFLLTSCRSLTLTLFSVLTRSVQPHQRFGIPFLTLSIHPILNSFRRHLKTLFPSCF